MGLKARCMCILSDTLIGGSSQLKMVPESTPLPPNSLFVASPVDISFQPRTLSITTGVCEGLSAQACLLPHTFARELCRDAGFSGPSRELRIADPQRVSADSALSLTSELGCVQRCQLMCRANAEL